MAKVNCRELRRRYELDGPERVVAWVAEAFAKKWVQPDHFTSIRGLFEATVPGGSELLLAMDPRQGGGIRLIEAGNAVDTSTFSNITGQIVYNRILQSFEDPQFIAKDLCETVKTEFLNGERIAGIGRIGDAAEVVDEGMPYPVAGLNEEFVDTAPTVKRGLIVPVTREILVADRTGLLMKRAGEVGEMLAINKEKRVIDVATGQVNNYKRNGTAFNTYLASGAYVNSQTNPLQSGDYTSIEKSELLLDGIKDPNTGEPVMAIADTVLVPSALIYTARRILHATQVRANDGAGNTFVTYSENPLAAPKDGNPPYKILSNRWVKQRTGSATQWFHGNFKKGVAYMEVWPIQVEQAPQNSEAAFVQDIVARFKATERGVAQVVEPRVMVQNN